MITVVMSRLKLTSVTTAIVATWPCVTLVELVQWANRDRTNFVFVLTTTIVLGALLSGTTTWFFGARAARAPGLWALYGILGAIPLASIVIGIAELTRPRGTFMSALLASILSLPFVAPYSVIGGALTGADVALVTSLASRLSIRSGPKLANGALVATLIIHGAIAALAAWALGLHT